MTEREIFNIARNAGVSFVICWAKDITNTIVPCVYDIDATTSLLTSTTDYHEVPIEDVCAEMKATLEASLCSTYFVSRDGSGIAF